MIKQKHIASVLFLFFLFSVNAQNDKLKYSQKLTISQGLTHNGVTSMLEDSKGFMWFGTYEGINRYDGYELKVYKNKVGNRLLTSNRVRSLIEDSKGNIWIGTDKGITIYKYALELFDELKTKSSINKSLNTSIIRDIHLDRLNELVICVSESNGLFVFKESDYSLLEHYVLNDKQNEDRNLYKIIQVDLDNYLVSTSDGLFNFNLRNGRFNRVLDNEINHCKSIIQLDKTVFMITLLNGVAVIDKSENAFTLRHKTLTSYQFNSALIDKNNNLWFGTLNHGILFIEDVQTFKTTNDFKFETFTDNLPILRSSTFLSTTNTNCWFATFNEGIYRFDINANPFHTYNKISDFENNLGSTSITHISPVDNNRVLLTSSLGGLALLNTKMNAFEAIPFAIPKEHLENVASVFVDSKKNIWIWLRGENSLRRYSKSKNEYGKIPNLKFSNPENSVLRSFAEDAFGNLWIAASTDLYKITLDNESNVMHVEQLSDHSYFKNENTLTIRNVYVDPLYDFVWVGSQSKGLIRIKNSKNNSLLDTEVNQYTHDTTQSNSITSNFVTSILRLPNEDFWIGTEGGGICKVLNSDRSLKFLPFTEKNGLSNNVVKNISFDSNYNLWVATNIGLNLFNTQKKEFRKFNGSNGLAFEDFWYATSNLKNGEIILSGVDGLIHFNPNDIPTVEELPNIHFENFKIFNQRVKPRDTINKRVLLNKTVSEIDEIILKHNENVFSVDITSLHYLNPKNHHIKYRLLPFNEEWIEMPSNQKTITYSGLQPGSYELSVMASNSLNDWTTPKTLNIEIRPSIWNTTLAYILYILLGLLLAYAILLIFLKIQSLNHKVVIEQLEKDKVEEVNEAKLRFFANISHEIKTPLTLISKPVDVLKQTYRNNLDVTDKLNLIKRQSKKIQQLLEQVQDFRKADAKALKMNYSRFNFDAFMQELIVDFQFLAKNDNKTLEIIKDDSTTIVSADKDKLEKIFNNILNNAFKYTKSNDSIKVEYTKGNDKDIVIRIVDTGKGIDPKDLAHIFERFYQSYNKDNTHLSGSGIGLAFSKRLVEMHYGFINANSELNVGTTIEVKLPIVKKHLPTDILETINLPYEEEVSITSITSQDDTTTDSVSSGEFSKAVIFYAEDNLEMRNFVSKLLSKYFIVKSFRNGNECYDAMEDEWPDIVISDVQMPEMNGLDLCQKIKSDLKTSHIPVILLTALTNIEDHLQGIKDGADAYIKKPFNVQRLIINVEALLTIRKQLRERYQVGIPLTKNNNKNNRNDNAFLEKLYSLIEDNLDNQEFDLNELARELYLNRTHFYQKVKVLTNQTPFELLKMYRLKKAAEFLVHKGLSVNETFMITGFKSRTHFTKVFKEHYKTSPGKYASEISKKLSNQ